MAKKSRMTGAADINRAFRNTASGLNVPLNDAARKSLRPMLREAKANLKRNDNIESGKLYSLLSIIRDRSAPKDKPTYAIGPDASKSPHYRVAHLVELGTAPHNINGWIHPGASPSPFMRPAFEAMKAEVIRLFGAEIGPAIERRIAAVARRAKR